MGLFKNEVGRPSNETLAKRRTIYIVLAVIVIALICGGVFYLKSFKDEDVSGVGKNAVVKDTTPPKIVKFIPGTLGVTISVSDNVKVKKFYITGNGINVCKSINKASVTDKDQNYVTKDVTCVK